MEHVSPQNAKLGDASWLPVIISIAVYPGVGQWMQKRRVSGSVYLVMFTLMAILFTWVLVVYLKQLMPVMIDALQGSTVEGREIPPLKSILQPFAIVLFIYFANVVDVLRGRIQLRHILLQK